VTRLRILRAGPLTTIQDNGRFGMLRHGISASGPMDRSAFAHAAELVAGAGPAGIECTMAGIEIEVISDECRVGYAGGAFQVKLNGTELPWPGATDLRMGDRLAIRPGPAGNYAYLRFDMTIDVPLVMGSRSTNIRVGLGGFDGRVLGKGDEIELVETDSPDTGRSSRVENTPQEPIRVLWGLHAMDLPHGLREGLLENAFAVSKQMDRMGVRLEDSGGVFADAAGLSLVSDAIVPGDIQILGDGTPVVLMRDHQPTGGYPRVATIISADLDRFAQLRSGTRVLFESVSLAHAQGLRTSGSVR